MGPTDRWRQQHWVCCLALFSSVTCFWLLQAGGWGWGVGWKGWRGPEEVVAAAPCTSFLILSWQILSNGLSPSKCPKLALSLKEHFCQFFGTLIPPLPCCQECQTLLYSPKKVTLAPSKQPWNPATSHAIWLMGNLPTFSITFWKPGSPTAVLSVPVHLQVRGRHQILCFPNSREYVIWEETQTVALSTCTPDSSHNDSLTSVM